MGFVKSLEEIMASIKPTADFYDAEMLTMFWETKPEIAAKLIPPPLQPTKAPIAMAFVANYPSTNFDVTYRESALLLRAQFKGEEGGYCLAMHVTNDMAMAGGREVFGFPKKMADIHFSRTGDTVKGWTERRGIRFMEVQADLNGRINAPDAVDQLMGGNVQPGGSIQAVAYNFKYFPAPEGGSFDYPPRLVKQETLFRPKEIAAGTVELTFKPSAYDPWSEVAVVRMLGGMYTKGDNSMLGGKVVAVADMIQFLPHAFLKWDMK